MSLVINRYLTSSSFTLVPALAYFKVHGGGLLQTFKDIMTKIINLDQLETRKDKAVILKGKEHIMKTLTVKDYILQLKTQQEIEKLSSKPALT
jgi:hypothetical protein